MAAQVSLTDRWQQVVLRVVWLHRKRGVYRYRVARRTARCERLMRQVKTIGFWIKGQDTVNVEWKIPGTRLIRREPHSPRESGVAVEAAAL